MKKTYLISILLLLTSFLTGSNNNATITGTLEDYKSQYIAINGNWFKTDENGKFSRSIKAGSSDFIKLKLKKTIRLFIRPGSTLTLLLKKGNPLSDMIVEGEHQKINSFLIKEHRNESILYDYLRQNAGVLFLKEPDQFTEELNRLYKPFFKRIEQFAATGRTGKDFKKKQIASLTYSKATIMLKYPMFRGRYSNTFNYKAPDSYYTFLNALNYENIKLLTNEDYRGFCSTLIEKTAKRNFKKREQSPQLYFGILHERVNTILKYFKNREIKNELLYKEFARYVDEYYLKNMTPLLDRFRKECSNKEYIKKIRVKAEKYRETGSRILKRIYKRAGKYELEVYIWLPENWNRSDRRGAIAFFHGGGWECGKPSWGQLQCEDLAGRGYVAMSFEYRLITEHDATPVESMIDAKSAIRWLRQNARNYGVNPNQIAASGFSAGGHIAACTVTTDMYNEEHEDKRVSSRANALILWSAAVKTDKDKWFSEHLKGDFRKEYNPAGCVTKGLPPTIIFHGDRDYLVPLKYNRKFSQDMQKAGNRCDLHIYKGQGHLGWSRQNVEDVRQKSDSFLMSLGFKKR